MTDLVEALKTHMEKQPYDVSCNRCGETLTYSTSVDADYDICILIDPCEHCCSSDDDE